LKLTGKLGGKTLKPGRYRLTLTAVDSGGLRSKSLRIGFRVLIRSSSTGGVDGWVLRLTVLTAAVAVLAVSGCDRGDGASPANDAQATPKVTVAMIDGAYIPEKARIRVGSRVTFFNRVGDQNTAETAHVGFFEYDRRVLDRKNLFDVHTVQQGEAESVEFDTPGTYRYRSSVDSEMRGVIEVLAPR
jgi:plastocyanin